ncbi:hypothetical protein [Anaeroselena agilis]|uniref:Uncharacterized protein n=1 Tax=Anaeroselena agilis TaxID=3063788 RepID=A0ABU3NT87_9FIRM|nr:hypothetical protein [Selenomonadales bacterium 4137-cl]
MAKITVHIEADSPSDYYATLQELIGGADAVVMQIKQEELAAALEPEKAKKTTTTETPATAPEPKPKKTAENKAPEPTVATPTADLDPAPAPDPTPATKEKKITHEDLRDAMQPLKREISLQLVAEFSGKTPEEKPKLSDVPAEKHAELLAEARRLAQLPENVKQAIA